MINRVFVIDEDVRVRDLIYELLSEVGYSVLTLPGGREALERLKRERPPYIIIDDSPSEYSGILLAKKIREFDKDIKIIMLGQEPQGTLASQVKEAEICAYLKKDFQNPETFKRILSILKEQIFVKPQMQKRWGSVLIVDDEPESREMIYNFLSRRGFEVETASSGEECLEKIKLRLFDIVLLDITMSGMDGLLTLKRIMDVRSQTKVIMVSAIHNKDMLTEAQAIGACDYIVKPFNLEMLESALLSVLLTKKMGQKDR